MESLKLKREDRNKLYFNRYKYKVTSNCEGVQYTYYCDTLDQFKDKIEKFKNDPWLPYIRNIDDKFIELDKIDKYLKWKKKNQQFVIIRTGHNLLSVFSNDLKKLKFFKKIDKDSVYVEANVIASQVLFFKNTPNFKYRIYLKGIRLTEKTSQQICNFVETYRQSQSLKISPTLVEAVRCNKIHYKRWIHNSYYIDYNAESTLSLLNLLLDNILSPKVYKLDSEDNKDKYSNNMECLNGQDN